MGDPWEDASASRKARKKKRASKVLHTCTYVCTHARIHRYRHAHVHACTYAQGAACTLVHTYTRMDACHAWMAATHGCLQRTRTFTQGAARAFVRTYVRTHARMRAYLHTQCAHARAYTHTHTHTHTCTHACTATCMHARPHVHPHDTCTHDGSADEDVGGSTCRAVVRAVNLPSWCITKPVDLLALHHCR